MKVLLLLEAAQQFEDAVVYLEEEEPGLGVRLRVVIDAHEKKLTPLAFCGSFRLRREVGIKTIHERDRQYARKRERKRGYRVGPG